VLNTALTVFPNPSTGVFQVKFDVADNSDSKLEVLDMQGRMLITKEISNASDVVVFEFDMNSYANGMYIVRLVTSNSVQTAKLQLLR
jgi:hypothetical protein